MVRLLGLVEMGRGENASICGAELQFLVIPAPISTARLCLRLHPGRRPHNSVNSPVFPVYTTAPVQR